MFQNDVQVCDATCTDILSSGFRGYVNAVVAFFRFGGHPGAPTRLRCVSATRLPAHFALRPTVTGALITACPGYTGTIGIQRM